MQRHPSYPSWSRSRLCSSWFPPLLLPPLSPSPPLTRPAYLEPNSFHHMIWISVISSFRAKLSLNEGFSLNGHFLSEVTFAWPHLPWSMWGQTGRQQPDWNSFQRKVVFGNLSHIFSKIFSKKYRQKDEPKLQCLFWSAIELWNQEQSFMAHPIICNNKKKKSWLLMLKNNFCQMLIDQLRFATKYAFCINHIGWLRLDSAPCACTLLHVRRHH